MNKSNNWRFYSIFLFSVLMSISNIMTYFYEFDILKNKKIVSSLINISYWIFPNALSLMHYLFGGGYIWLILSTLISILLIFIFYKIAKYGTRGIILFLSLFILLSMASLPAIFFFSSNYMR